MRQLWIPPGVHMFHFCPMSCTGYQYASERNSLVVICKDLHGMGPGYLWDHLCLIVSTHPITSGRKRTLWFPLMEECHLACHRIQTFCRGTFPLEYHSSREYIGLDLASVLQSSEDLVIFPALDCQLETREWLF